MGEALKTTYENSENAKKLSRASFFIAALAFIASSVSVYFSYQDSITDEAWQNSQINLIEKLVNESSLLNKQYAITIESSKKEIEELKKTNKLLLEILNNDIATNSKANKSLERNKLP